MRERVVLAVAFLTIVLVLLAHAPASQAAPGSLKILYASNLPSVLDPGIVPAIKAEPGVGEVDSFNTSTGTPTAATLATYDLVVSVGDSNYNDPVTWGNELADYLDAGGAVIQFAYDNWNSPGASPTGRFASGGYAPFVTGNNDNLATTLGTITVPGSPLIAGVTTLSTHDNTTDALAPGATLLATWADGRNAIATKGRVVSVTASLDSGSFSPDSTIAQLVVNAGNVLGRHALTVTTNGSGAGTVTSSPTGINCPSTCTFDYTNGTPVTLTAVPATGSTASLNGPGCSGAATCTVTLNSPTAVTATFTAIPVVPTPVPTPALTPAPPPPSLSLNGASGSGPTANLSLTCHGVAGQACVGGVTGTVQEHKRAGALIAVTASKKHPGKPKVKIVPVTVAQTSFSIPAGSTQTVSVPSNAAGKQLLTRLRKLPVKLAITGIATTPTVTLKLPVTPIRVTTLPDSWFHINLPCSNCYTTPQSVPIAGIPAGGHATVTCHGAGCPSGQRSLTPAHGTVNLASALGGAHLEPGDLVKVVISAPGHTSETITYKIQRGSVPLRTIG